MCSCERSWPARLLSIHRDTKVRKHKTAMITSTMCFSPSSWKYVLANYCTVSVFYAATLNSIVAPTPTRICRRFLIPSVFTRASAVAW